MNPVLPLGPDNVMKLGRDLRCHNCRDVPGVSESSGQGPGGTMEALTLTVVCHEGRPPAHGIFPSAAVVEGHLVAVGVGEYEGAAERPVDGR